MKEGKRRYVGIDLGKREYTMAVISVNGKMSIHKGKTNEHGRQALYRLLEKGDKIALEAGDMAFRMAREIMQLAGSEVRVLNSANLPFIWDAPTKTDKEDAMKLAHLFEERRDEKLPIVPLPSEEELERLETLANYSHEKKGRTRVINTLHSLFWKQGHTEVVRKNLATADKGREPVLQGSASKQLLGVRPAAGLFRNYTAAWPYNKKRQCLPAGLIGTSGMVYGSFPKGRLIERAV